MATIRICPERDAACPHGVACPYSTDRHRCDLAASRAAIGTSVDRTPSKSLLKLLRAL